jgi:hypothetical protein
MTTAGAAMAADMGTATATATAIAEHCREI